MLTEVRFIDLPLGAMFKLHKNSSWMVKRSDDLDFSETVRGKTHYFQLFDHTLVWVSRDA